MLRRALALFKVSTTNETSIDSERVQAIILREKRSMMLVRNTDPKCFCIGGLIPHDSICVLVSCFYRVSELVLSKCYQLIVISQALQQFSALTITRSFNTSYPNFRYRSCASLVISIPRRPVYSGRDCIYDTSAVPSPIC